ncbi:MAG: pentapeptide repeat-containing protein [Alphaproteobacteria bacterium]|nr:pentapeptide repeat-containing protein [Alphaproteobacteria bacterium]
MPRSPWRGSTERVSSAPCSSTWTSAPPTCATRPVNLTLARLAPELQRALREHAVWADSGGAHGIRAVLDGQDLAGVELSGAYLSGASLVRCNLADAILSGAKLILADLREANLTGADLRRADLSGTVLVGAKLVRAKLAHAVLKRVELRDGQGRATGKVAPTNLRGASLIDADLSFADLSEAAIDPPAAAD